MDEPTLAVFGLPGFRLLKVSERNGELEYLIETIDTPVGCTRYGNARPPQGPS